MDEELKKRLEALATGLRDSLLTQADSEARQQGGQQKATVLASDAILIQETFFGEEAAQELISHVTGTGEQEEEDGDSQSN